MARDPTSRKAVWIRLASVAMILLGAGVAAVWTGYLSIGFGPEGPTYGMILVEGPQIYTRERLVNDRYREDEWLNTELDLSKTIPFGVQAKMMATTSSSANMSMNFAPAGTDPSFVTAASRGNDPTPPKGADATVTISPAPESVLKDRGAYREEIRNMMIENQLDDRHDLLGNSLYRLKFDETIIPGNNSTMPAKVEVSVVGPPALFGDADFNKPTKGLEQLRKITSIFDLSLEQKVAWMRLYDGWLDSVEGRFEQTRAEFHDAYRENRLTGDEYLDLLRDLRKTLRLNLRKTPRLSCDALFTDDRRAAEAYLSYQLGSDEPNTDWYVQRTQPWHIEFKLLIARLIASKAIIDKIKSSSEGPQDDRAACQTIVQEEVSVYPNDGAQDVLYPAIDHAFEEKIWRVVLGRGRSGGNFQTDALGRYATFIVDSKAPPSQRAFLLRRFSIPVTFAKAGTTPSWLTECSTKKPEDPPVASGAGAIGDHKDKEDARLPLVADALKQFTVDGAPYIACARTINLVRLAAPEYDLRRDLEAAARTAVTEGASEFAADVPIGLFNFIRAVTARVDVYSYAVTPREVVKRIDRASSSTSMRGLSSAIAARFAAVGLSAGADMSEAGSKSQEDLLRRPLVVGYGDQRAEALAKFGWVAQPEETSAPGALNPNYRHNVAQHSLTALVSLPAWWDSVALKVETSWIGRNGLASDDPSRQLSPSFIVPLPVEYETLEVALLPTQGHGPEVLEGRIGKLSVTACSPASLLIPGRRLWRSSVVTIAGQQSTGIFVLPDMRGIIATFGPIRMPDGWDNTEKPFSALVTVWTSQGSVTLKRRVTINYPKSDRSDKIKHDCSQEKSTGPGSEPAKISQAR